METKHSPGPWRAEGWKETVVNDANGNTLALCPGDIRIEGIEVIQANARLIAAAPSMYRVLSRIAEYLQAGQDRVSLSALMHDGDDTIGQALRAAIALAEGREVTG